MGSSLRSLVTTCMQEQHDACVTWAVLPLDPRVCRVLSCMQQHASCGLWCSWLALMCQNVGIATSCMNRMGSSGLYRCGCAAGGHRNELHTATCFVWVTAAGGHRDDRVGDAARGRLARAPQRRARRGAGAAGGLHRGRRGAGGVLFRRGRLQAPAQPCTGSYPPGARTVTQHIMTAAVTCWKRMPPGKRPVRGSSTLAYHCALSPLRRFRVPGGGRARGAEPVHRGAAHAGAAAGEAGPVQVAGAYIGSPTPSRALG